MFTTTKATDLSSGADIGSLLAMMFDDGQPLGKKMIDDGYFFDRDGILFSFILAYLRDGTHQVASILDENLVAVKIEAEFFQLAGELAEENTKTEFSPYTLDNILESKSFSFLSLESFFMNRKK